MKKVFSIFFLLFPISLLAQQAEVVTFEQLENQYIKSEDDTLYVLNFWATWCAPCVKELPHFEKAGEEFKNRPVKIILVSLDFKNQLETRLNPFIKKRKLKNKVVFLDAPKENIWVPKVSEDWSGAIPATLMINPKTGCMAFYEKEFTFEELTNTINENLKPCKK